MPSGAFLVPTYRGLSPFLHCWHSNLQIPSQANKSGLLLFPHLRDAAAHVAIFAYHREGIRTCPSLKKKNYRLSDQSKLKNRAPGRVKGPNLPSAETAHPTSISKV